MRIRGAGGVILAMLGACSTPPPMRPSVPVALTIPSIPSAQSLDQLLRDYVEAGRYRTGEPTAMTPTADGRAVLFLRRSLVGKNGLWQTDVATGATRELLRPEDVLAGEEHVSTEERARRERQRQESGGFAFFEMAADGSLVIVAMSDRLFAFTPADGKVRELEGAAGAIDPQLSPDAKYVAYVRDNDVRMLALDGGGGGKETAITRGGTELRPHGLAEFMAQEEFSRNHGFWWSPDGSEILVQESDLSPVPVWTLADPAHPEKPARTVRYPKTGAPNAIVGLAFVSVRAPAQQRSRVTWDTTRYPYLSNVTWSKNAPPTIDVRSRDGQHASVLVIDAVTGTTRALVSEDDPAWVNLDASVPRWLPDGQSFLWSTERNGAYELELRSRDGKTLRTLSPPGGGYRSLVAVDAERQLAFYMTSPDAIRNELWAASLDGSAPPHLVARHEDGTVWASAGRSARIFAVAEAGLHDDHEFTIRDRDGVPVAKIPSLAKTPRVLPDVELRRLPLSEAQVAIVRPRNFDARRTYPVIDSIYGGPWFNVVKADAYTYLEEQWLADAADAVVVKIDARGTGLRDRAWQRAFQGHFGDLPVDGHADAIGELASRIPEIDPARVGIYGWSNGGYLSALAVLRRPEVFKVAVAGAPVADLRDYDAVLEFFGPAYEESSLLTWAARSPTPVAPARPLLVFHGTADDNVYFAHSLKLVSTMELAGRHAELVPLVERSHMDGSAAATIAVLRRTADYFRQHL